MDYYNKTLIDTVRWGRMGAIACRIADKMGISPLQALKDFYRSVTCAKFHDRKTGLYLYSDYYIADSFFIEKNLENIC